MTMLASQKYEHFTERFTLSNVHLTKKKVPRHTRKAGRSGRRIPTDIFCFGKRHLEEGRSSFDPVSRSQTSGSESHLVRSRRVRAMTPPFLPLSSLQGSNPSRNGDHFPPGIPRPPSSSCLAFMRLMKACPLLLRKLS